MDINLILSILFCKNIDKSTYLLYKKDLNIFKLLNKKIKPLITDIDLYIEVLKDIIATIENNGSSIKRILQTKYNGITHNTVYITIDEWLYRNRDVIEDTDIDKVYMLIELNDKLKKLLTEYSNLDILNSIFVKQYITNIDSIVDDLITLRKIR